MNAKELHDALNANPTSGAELGKFSDRNGYALRHRAERAEAALAKLRQHAEAMAESIDRTVFSTTAQQDALAAYRADFPAADNAATATALWSRDIHEQ